MADHAHVHDVGRVIGTDDATPLEFWVAIEKGAYLQLDDVVALERQIPGGEMVRIYGMVTQVRARHDGARFDSDVFLVGEGLLPASISEAAKVLATRFEPETFIPPLPGAIVRRARGAERDTALYFDAMKERQTEVPIGLSRDDETVFANLEFIDGTRGAHVNISGVSGVATKTSYALFLLYSLFHSDILKDRRMSTRALVFNVKGEDLLHLDRPNATCPPEQLGRYGNLNLPAGPFGSVAFWAPPRRGVPSAAPDVHSRQDSVTAFFWTLKEFCHEDLLPFLFADAEDDRQQYTIVMHNVMAHLRDAIDAGEGGVRLAGREVRTFAQLVEAISDELADPDGEWRGHAITQGTVNAFLRRLYGSVRHVGHLIRGDVPGGARHRVSLDTQVTVVGINNLNERAQRFVVGALLRKTFDDKEAAGGRTLHFVVLDELNKYAPRDGSSPIKEVLLEIAERGRSLGIILVGAQQTASEVERRIVANSAIRVVGRLDSAEAGREEYGFLPPSMRQRATILKPGTMIVSQPELPVPVLLEFPFPAWATRASEVAGPPMGDDPFNGLVRER